MAGPSDVNTCRVAALLPEGSRLLNVGQPLQVGGMAHPVPDHTFHGWPDPLFPKPLLGCVRNLRVNGQASHNIDFNFDSSLVIDLKIVSLYCSFLLYNHQFFGGDKPVNVEL